MATGFLILHGVENHRPPEHWQFLLAAQLVEHGLEVRYPALPEPDAPELERWLATLEQELAALGGEQRVVVCHSLACLLWFHAPGAAPTARSSVCCWCHRRRQSGCPTAPRRFGLTRSTPRQCERACKGEMRSPARMRIPTTPRVPNQAAAEHIGVPPAEIVLVSAHWWDVTGAKRVGLGTAWVSANEQVLMPGSPAPDVQAPSLLDVTQGIVNKVGEREQ